MGKGLIDLESHFVFYGAYHCNPVNIFIHTLFVWPILFTLLLLLHFVPPPLALHFPIADGLGLNLGFVVALLYGLFYVLMDRRSGFSAAVLCYFCWVGGDWIATRIGFSLAWKVVLVTQVVCWTFQFIGHGVFEKRAPALLDDLPQALVMAPFFVYLEVIGKLFGYEPYPGFWPSVNAKIEEARKEWEKKHQKKLA